MPIYQEIWDGPGRNFKRVNGEPQLAAKWYATIHNTSNDATARQEASYAKRRTDGVGAHHFADNIEVRQSTDTDRCVGHVGSTQGNTRGISYEITGVNSWTRAQWLANVAWDKLAAVIARDCRHFGIPVRLLTLDQMRAYNADNKGFITHDMARRAWGRTDHTDPGPNFPMDHLLALVRQHMGASGEDDDTMFCQYGDKGPKVKALQLQLLQLDPGCLPRFGADSGYGEEVRVALSRLVTGGDAKEYGPDGWALLQSLVAAKVAGGAGKGDQGDPGPPGKTPSKVKVVLEADVIEFAPAE